MATKTEAELHDEANTQSQALYEVLQPAAHRIGATGLSMLFLIGVLVDDVLAATQAPGGLDEVLRAVRASALEARRARGAEESAN